VQPYQSYYKGSLVDLDTLRKGPAGAAGTPPTSWRAVARELGATDSGRQARRRGDRDQA